MSFENAEVLADSVFVGAPGSPLVPRPTVRIVDAAGHAVAGALIRWTPLGAGSHVERYNARSTANGEASAEWYLGTNAREEQQLLIEAVKGGARTLLLLRATAKPSIPQSVRVASDTAIAELGARISPVVIATDAFGNDFVPDGTRYRVLTGQSVVIGVDGRPAAVARGASAVEARVDSLTDTTVVLVVQRVASIGTSGSTRIGAIGSTAVLRTLLTDVNGLAVADSAPLATVADTQVARVRQSGDTTFVTATGSGLTTLTLSAGAVERRLPVLVQQVVARVAHQPDSLAFTSLRDTATVSAHAQDSAGVVIAAAPVTLAARDPSVVGIDPSGVVQALRNGDSWIVATVGGVAYDSLPVHVAQVPSSLEVGSDSLMLTALGATRSLGAVVRDARGEPIIGAPVAITVEDTSVARATAGSVTAVRNGATSLVLRAGTVARSITVIVEQRAARILSTVDTVQIAALGARQSIAATAVDSLGNPMRRALSVAPADSQIARAIGADSVEGVSVGTTTMRLTAGAVSTDLPVRVWQRPARITVQDTLFDRPLAVAAEARLAIGAVVRDANGYEIPGAPLSATATDPAVASVPAGDTIVIAGSGATEIVVSSGTLVVRRPLRVYLPPQLVQRRIAATIDADTALGSPWAPTLTMAPNGEVRLYFAAYKRDASVGYDRADLAYLTSTDTLSFHYAGTAIAHQPLADDPYGWGIENVVVAPRTDSSGMRIYFSGGSRSNGWQVFSAVGDGVGAWRPEPGVRVTNGSLHLYPQGEGMVVLPDSSGGLRMILGSMQLASGPANSWAIVEFSSPNGLDWSFSGPVIRPGAPGSGTERAVYSPTIVPFGKRAWRMFYTGDNLNRVQGGGASHIWSAVSFDLRTWTVEGIALPAVDGNLYYASALGDKVAYIRTPAEGGVNRIEIARFTQR